MPHLLPFAVANSKKPRHCTAESPPRNQVSVEAVAMLKISSEFRADDGLDERMTPAQGGVSTRIFLKKIRSISPLFLLAVLLPTLIATLYFGLFASDIYISESRFIVRSPDKPSSSTLGVLLKSAGFSNASDEMSVAKDYITSRDALRIANSDGLVTRAYTASHISIFDRFNPFGWDGSFEALFKYYGKHVSVAEESSSSISSVSVEAYSPEDAYQINVRLLAQAERLVNQLNERGRKDLIKFASDEVAVAKERAERAALALAAFRNREGVVDPELQASGQLQMISKLQDELIATRNQLSQLRTVAPQNAQIPVLEAKLKGLSGAIDTELSKVAGGSKSLAGSAVRYQRLELENQVAGKDLAAAMTSLEDARNEARRKQAYVETIAKPVRPDAALRPRRLRGIFSTFALGLVAWGVLSMLLAGIKEHRE